MGTLSCQMVAKVPTVIAPESLKIDKAIRSSVGSGIKFLGTIAASGNTIGAEQYYVSSEIMHFRCTVQLRIFLSWKNTE